LPSAIDSRCSKIQGARKSSDVLFLSAPSNKEAARMLGIPRTVEFHRANVMRNLGVRNTADVVRRLLGD
jgi:FixJ family two-component response regulator